MHETPLKPRPLSPQNTLWQDLADRALADQPLSREQGLAVLRSGDQQLLELLAAAYRVRHHWFGNRVQLNFLINAKCGACGEDCGYCAQSKVSTADIPHYRLLTPEQILDGARLAAERRSNTYCIVTAGRQPGQGELDLVEHTVPQIKAQYGMAICVSSGLLTAEEAARLKACGVDRVNHNLNTSRRFYPQICSTHSYQDRLDTLHAARQAGLELCSGGIVGMGEEDGDVVDLALELGHLAAEAVPVNFFEPIPGTPLENRKVEDEGDRSKFSAGDFPESRVRTPKIGPVPSLCGSPKAAPLDPRYCLKVLALFRLANPRCELRIAAGREMHLRRLQPLGLYAANSMFVGGYLTTKGQSPEEDFHLLEDLGFESSERL